MDEDGFGSGEDIVRVEVRDSEVVDRLDAYRSAGARDGEVVAVRCQASLAYLKVVASDPLAVGSIQNGCNAVAISTRRRGRGLSATATSSSRPSPTIRSVTSRASVRPVSGSVARTRHRSNLGKDRRQSGAARVPAAARPRPAGAPR